MIVSMFHLVGAEPSRGVYYLVGFNTVDEGMVYYEATTDYRVFPEIDKKYVDCVEGNPYASSLITNDEIIDILIIWWTVFK